MLRLLWSLLLTALLLPASLSACREAETTPRDNVVMPETTIPLIDANGPAVTETATFALGWFWGPDSRFGSLEGVVRTRVGYAGGATANPTYYDLDGHSETIQVDYDPTKISYEDLLDVFWASHNPTFLPWSQQYMSIIFYHSEEQQRLAIETKEREENRLGNSIVTTIIPFSEFYSAEDYHQKYYLQQELVLWNELRTIYPKQADLVASTAAARLNGYAGGYGSWEILEAELDSYGLSPAAQNSLREIANRGLASGCALT